MCSVFLFSPLSDQLLLNSDELCALKALPIFMISHYHVSAVGPFGTTSPIFSASVFLCKSHEQT